MGMVRVKSPHLLRRRVIRRQGLVISVGKNFHSVQKELNNNTLSQLTCMNECKQASHISITTGTIGKNNATIMYRFINSFGRIDRPGSR